MKAIFEFNLVWLMFSIKPLLIIFSFVGLVYLLSFFLNYEWHGINIIETMYVYLILTGIWCHGELSNVSLSKRSGVFSFIYTIPTWGILFIIFGDIFFDL